MVWEVNAEKTFNNFMDHALAYGFNTWSCNSYAPTMYWPIANYLRDNCPDKYTVKFEKLKDNNERFIVTLNE